MTPPAGHSAAAAVLRSAARHFRAGVYAISPDGWRAWLWTVGAGVAGVVLLMVLLVQAGRRLLAAGSLDWEPAVLYWLRDHGPLDFPAAVFFQTFGTDVTLLFLIAATAGLAVRRHRPITALSIFLAPVVADQVGRFGWLLWDRARPDLLYDGIAAPGLHSFPSGHASKTMATYGLLTLIWMRASRNVPERLLALILLVLIATVVPTGRMTMGVHWPSDIIAGLILGLAWLAVLGWGLRYENVTREPGSVKRGA